MIVGGAALHSARSLLHEAGRDGDPAQDLAQGRRLGGIDGAQQFLVVLPGQ
ncbi:hypothetical protein [Nonomuraea sp. WAC 01424]|uniref:hypothetical protein n=1 Tax=Nonomuraea sp. WAC 01424 TaxID=2203200 RepID=UPI00163C2A8B|nr:hypothetical protein [Nonomuraea sp. WAC 01424]